MNKITRALSLLLVFATLLTLCAACGTKDGKNEFVPEDSKYNSDALWAFKETDKTEKVDTFFVAPTVVSGEFYNMPTDNEELKSKFRIQTENQKGIYDDKTRFFAPYYSQVTLQCYSLEETEKQNYLSIAYEDVKAAFEYYLNVYNNGNGIILAGSSQGADMILRLVRDFFNDKKNAEKLVCVYAIGWKVTEEYMKGLKNVRFATGEADLKSIVSFNSESPEITKSMIIGENEKTLCINPLNWSTGTAAVSKDKNLGCCMFSTKGGQKGDDMVGFCGAYIDETRGTLKVTDVLDPEHSLYPSRLDGQEYGVYHIYDWEFFYRNLEKNVQTRVGAYLSK